MELSKAAVLSNNCTDKTILLAVHNTPGTTLQNLCPLVHLHNNRKYSIMPVR